MGYYRKIMCPHCHKEFNAELRIERRNCAYCGAEFIQNRPHQIYCSRECGYRGGLLKAQEKRKKMRIEVSEK